MKREYLKYLCCPNCQDNDVQANLILRQIIAEQGDRIKEAILACTSCNTEFPIKNFIPRFVSENNYSNNFGLQWNIHYKTQYDSYINKPITRNRFFETTHWNSDLTGEIILEAGCGAGRFTEQVLQTGATLISFDYSSAVDANYKNNGIHDKLFIVQADIRCPPFCFGSFDKIFCFGVLQHTPNPEQSFNSLPRFLKKTGHLAIDVYKKNRFGKLLSFTPAPPSKYLFRPLTKRMPAQLLYKMIRVYINMMWPICKIIRKIPKVGRQLNWLLLVADHSDLELSDETAREWAYLNTFDMLSPSYDIPQRLSTVRQWFVNASFKKFEVEYGYNGIVARTLE